MKCNIRLHIIRVCNVCMGILANSEDPDEMPHKEAFYQGLQCLHGHFANSEDPDVMPHKGAFHQGLHCLHRHIGKQ